MFGKKKLFIYMICGVLVISIIIVLLLIFLRKNEPKIEEQPLDTETLEMEFNDVFKNEANEYITCMYNIKEEKSGKYNITAHIPYIQTNSKQINNEINKNINDSFIKKLLEVYNNSQIYTVLSVDYAVSVNNDILSLAVRCTIKEGPNSKRVIIKTYNYNLQNNKSVDILDIIHQDKEDEIQKKISERIKKEIKKENTITEQGYNVYRRDENSDIYLLKNATEFFIDKDILYIIYCYGNNNYTSQIDTIITKI